MKSISGWVPAEIAERQANERSRPERDPDEAYDRKVQRDMDNESRIIDKRMALAPQPMSPLGQHLAQTLTLANEAARIYIRLGRAQFCEEVRRIVGTASARKPLDAVVQELIELCNLESAK